MGIILETFHSAGTLPEVKLLLKRSARDEEMYGAQHLSNFAGILSGPVALSSKERRARRTSSGEIYLLRRRLGSEGNSLGTRLALIGSISGRCPQICPEKGLRRR